MIDTYDKHTSTGVITLGYVGGDNKRTHQSGMVFGVGGGSTDIICSNVQRSCKDNRQKKGR